jgi:ankyrin repeat protein
LGNTALMVALEENNFEIAKLLIENNAEVNVQNNVFIFFYVI